MSESRDVRPTELGGPDQRILLLVSGERDRELLADRLGDRHEVDAGEPDADWGEFDLCVADAGTYRTVAEDLATLKADTDTYLPVLLLIPDRAGTREAAWLAEELGGTVDDVLVVPAPKHELDARVEALLRARRQSRQLALYRRAMDEATLGITITDPDRPDNPIVYANDWFCRLTGYDRADVLGRNCRFLQGPETDETKVAEISETIDNEEPITVELLNYRADGDPFWNLLTITPVRDDQGEVTHFLGFQRDVTERVETAESLRAERELLEQVFDTSPVGITVIDADGDIVRANETAEAELGLERSEITARTFDSPEWEIFDEDGDPIPTEDLPAARVMRTGEPVEDYRHGIRVDGEERWLSVNAAPLFDESGNVDSVVSSVRDITDRLDRERELERYEAIVEATSDLIYVLDREGHFVSVNDAMVEASGYDREDLLGSHASMVADDETVEMAERYIRELLQGDREQATFEGTMVFAGGVRREFAASINIMREDGEFQGTVVVAHDITELRESQRRLTVLDRVLRHNLRNRMNVVLGYSQELGEHADSEVAHLGEAIEDSARNLLQLSESAREFESVISGAASETTTIDATDLVEASVDDARTDHPEADIRTELPAAAPVRAHETFELALRELLENAIVHNDAATPTVDVSVTAGDEQVAIRIADDGPGLNDIDRRALLAGTESPLEHTQGLGLWLVRWAVESVGGHLDIADNDPHGTVFTLSLPRATD